MSNNFNNNRNSNSNRRPYNGNRNGGNNDTRFNGNNRPRMSDDERARRAAERQAKIAAQKNKLDIIEASIEFFNGKIKENNTRISVKELYDFLSSEKGIDIADAKKASDIVYIVVDLANAFCNRSIQNSDFESRIRIRIEYLRERLFTTFDKSYTTHIYSFFDGKYGNIFPFYSSANEEVENLIATADITEDVAPCSKAAGEEEEN